MILDLPRELINWMRTGLGVLLLAFFYLLSIATVVLVAAFGILRGFLRYKRPLQVICPLTKDPAELHIAPLRAAIAGLFGEREFRIVSCSSNQRLEHCTHTCVSQIP